MTTRSCYSRSTAIALAVAIATLTLACRPPQRDTVPDAPKETDSVPRVVSFPTTDGGVIFADQYGAGERGVVLAHGGRFNKKSWENQARILAQAKFRVLAIDFRGYGKSHGGSKSPGLDEAYPLDVLAAAAYLRENGVTTVSIVGASFGGWAAAGAVVAAKPGEIDRLVLLAASSIDEPERLTGRKLFIASRNDVIGDGHPRLPLIRKLFERAPEPKELVVLDGSAHAQHIFKTDQGERLMDEILRFLSEP